MNFFQRLWRGLNWSEKYGHHPGWLWLVIMLLFGAAYRGWAGLALILVFVGIPFLIGAWHRGD